MCWTQSDKDEDIHGKWGKTFSKERFQWVVCAQRIAEMIIAQPSPTHHLHIDGVLDEAAVAPKDLLYLLCGFVPEKSVNLLDCNKRINTFLVLFSVSTCSSAAC